MSESTGNVWSCKIGALEDVTMPQGGDAPMREAVERAFEQLTGKQPDACFSGWGVEFNQRELAVIHRGSQDPEALKDEVMVSQLHDDMLAKLEKKRGEGYGRWYDADIGHLANLLVGHIVKGDPVDIANFAGMLHALTAAVGPEGIRSALQAAMSDYIDEATKGLGIRSNY